MTYWKVGLEKRVNGLELQGFKTDWARSILSGAGITKDLNQLVSLDGELHILPFFDKNVEHGDRIDFIERAINIEVWTPLDIEPQRKVIRRIDAIFQSLSLELGCLHQIIYSPCKTPYVLKYEKHYLADGPVKCIAEILFDISGFQKEVARLFMNKVRKREGKFLKEKKRGAIAIDIRHLSVVDPLFLCSQLKKSFLERDARTLDGICLITFDPYTPEGETRLILIPNDKSSRPLSPDNFPNGKFVEPFQVPFTYALPTIIFTEKPRTDNLLLKREKDIFIINGKTVARSLAADAPIAFVSLTERPEGLSEVAFKTENREAKIHF